MKRPELSLACVLLLAACGKPIVTATAAPSEMAPADAYRCVLGSWKALGFKRTVVDDEELRTSARKENPHISMSSTALRKTYDRLDVEVRAGARGTEMNVVASTATEYLAQNGTNVEPQKTSAEAQQAARQLETRCGGATAATDSVARAAQ